MRVYRSMVFAITASMLLLTSGAARGQSELLIWDGEPGSVANPLPDITGLIYEWPVGINLRGIVFDDAARQRITVVVPYRAPITFELINFEARAGFIWDGFLTPDPNASDADIAYSWYGFAPGGPQMTITVLRGVMAATIQYGGRRVYAVGGPYADQVLREFDLVYLSEEMIFVGKFE